MVTFDFLGGGGAAVYGGWFLEKKTRTLLQRITISLAWRKTDSVGISYNESLQQ